MEISEEKFNEEDQEGLQCMVLPQAHKAPPLGTQRSSTAPPSKLPPDTGFHGDAESLGCC